MLKLIRDWGRTPEIAKKLDPARLGALNSIMALIATGHFEGLFNTNLVEINERMLQKFIIAFEMGYYAASMQEKSNGCLGGDN